MASEDNDTATVKLTSTGDNITREDNSDNDSLSVVLTTKPLGTITVSLSSSDNVSGGFLDNQSLTFTASNWNTAQIVTVFAVKDYIDDGTYGSGDNTTFTVTIDNVSSDNSSDLYDESTLLTSKALFSGAMDNITFVAVDNDTVGITLTPVDNSTSENGDSGSFSVRLNSQPTDNVSLFFADNDTSGRSLGIRFVPDNLSFDNSSDNWSSAQTVMVYARNDYVDEGNAGPDNQSFLAYVSRVTSNDAKYASISSISTHGGSIDNLTFLAEDNDTAMVKFTLVDSDNATSEDGDNATISVVLMTEPYDGDNTTSVDNLTVSLSSSDNVTGLNLRLDGVSSLQHSLTFTSASGNWSSAQTLTLVAVNDDYDCLLYTSPSPRD